MTAPAVRHRCTSSKTSEASRLEVLEIVLDQPLSLARVRYSPDQLLALDVEAQRLRDGLVAAGRCVRCGAVRLPAAAVSS